MYEKLRRKISTTVEVLKFMYGKYPISAISRDALSAGVTIAQLYAVTISGKFIDATAEIFSNWNSFSWEEYFLTDSFYYLAVTLILWMVAQIGTQLSDYFYTRIYEQSWMDANQVMMREISDSNLQDVESKEFQDLIAYVPAYAIDNVILSYSATSYMIGQVIRMVSSLVILAQTLSWTSLLLVLFVLPEVIASYKSRKEIRIYSQRSVKNLKFLNYLKNISLRIPYFPELRVDDTFTYIRNTYKEKYSEYLEGLLDGNEEYFAKKTLWSLIDQILKYVFLIYLLAKAVIEKLSLGTFIAMYNYVEAAYDSAFQFFDYTAILSDRLGYAEAFFSLSDFEGFGEISHGKKKLKKGTPLLEFQNLDFSYPEKQDEKVLENISFRIEPGEKVAFFGGDGSGKSTLVNILCGLYEIVAGDFSIGGYSIREIGRGELKSKIAVVFQNFVDYDFTLKENITISDKRKGVDELLYEKVVKIAEVDKVIKKEKIGKKQILGKYFEGGKEISPGFWQRIAIARMLYRNRDIFIMDEPFSYIDGQSREKILDGVLNFAGKNRTVIYVTKDTDNLDKFDRIYYLENGKIAESGSWEELKRKKGKLYKEIRFNR
jgi:ATP-binding cassette subfamily B protein